MGCDGAGLTPFVDRNAQASGLIHGAVVAMSSDALPTRQPEPGPLRAFQRLVK